MSQYQQPSWPSSSPSGTATPQSQPTKQGMGSFRDSIERYPSEETESRNKKKRRASKGRMVMLLKEIFSSFFSRRKKERFSQTLSEVEKRKEFEEVHKKITISDEELIEILSSLARSPDKNLIQEKSAKKLIEQLSLPLKQFIKKRCNISSKSDEEQSKKDVEKTARLHLELKVLREAKECLYFVNEAKETLKKKELSVDDQLKTLKKMLEGPIQLFSHGCLDLLAEEFWNLFTKLYLKTKERLMIAFLECKEADSWSKSLSEAMVKSKNAFKLKSLFNQYAGEKSRDFSSEQAIEKEIQFLEKKDREVLKRIQLEYYHATSLSADFLEDMKEWVKDRPQDLEIIIGIALYESKKVAKETLIAIQKKQDVKHHVEALLQYHKGWYETFIATCSQLLGRSPDPHKLAWESYQKSITPIVKALLECGEDFLSRVATTCLNR